MTRFLANCILFLAVFFLPPYLTFLLILACIFLFNEFVESILWAYMLDVLYGGAGSWGIHFNYFFTVCACLFFFFSFQLKKMLKFYSVS